MKPVQSILLLDSDRNPDLAALLSSRGYELVIASSLPTVQWAHQTGCDAVLKPFTPGAVQQTEGLTAPSSANAVETLADCEKRHILAVLAQCHWNRTHAAAKLAISVRTLRNKLKEYREAAAAQNQLVEIN
jgi:DNA-binding NtrC family response regulator